MSRPASDFKVVDTLMTASLDAFFDALDPRPTEQYAETTLFFAVHRFVSMISDTESIREAFEDDADPDCASRAVAISKIIVRELKAAFATLEAS